MIIAIDYSMSCPAMCISTSKNWVDAKFWFLTDKKKYVGTFIHDKITGDLHKDWKSPQERYDNISSYFMSVIDTRATNCDVFIEDYSMGSKGLVYSIGENCGLLKHKLWIHKHDIILVPPTVIKKFATGRGNADKLMMREVFNRDAGADLMLLGSIGTSPSSDIIDSWYLLRYGLTVKGC